MVNLKSVTVTHKNGTTALKRVSLRIDDGEFVLINGHSGAGKSTIVRLLTAEDVPTSGEVVIDGVNTKNLTHRQIPKFRRRLGVVFQDFRLIPTMNVFDNIAFAMRAVGRGRKEIKKRVAAVMEIVGLTGKEKSLPTQLSGGEQQRVALARAIVNNPKMIIADEPTGNIDPKMSAEVMDMFSLINQTGITVIVVTHEQAFVDTLDARVITLDHGNILNDTAHPEVAEELRLRRAAQNGDSEDEDKNEEEAVSEKKAVPEKLRLYGFCENERKLSFEAVLSKSLFRMKIDIFPDGRAAASVTDPASDEEYTLHLSDMASGSFVGGVREDFEALLRDISEKCFVSDVFRSDELKKLIAYAKNTYGSDPEFLWEDSPRCAILRRADTGKWYCVIMAVAARRIGIENDGEIEIINLHGIPEDITADVGKNGIYPGWHMNKKHWYTVVPDGALPLDELCRRVDESYRLAGKRK